MNESPNRKSGLYWVKWGKEWTVGDWDDDPQWGGWVSILGLIEGDYTDSDFTEINEIPLIRPSQETTMTKIPNPYLRVRDFIFIVFLAAMTAFIFSPISPVTFLRGKDVIVAMITPIAFLIYIAVVMVRTRRTP